MKTVAVVGLGSIAKRHIANLRDMHPNSRIYAVSATGSNKELPENADAILNLDELIGHQPDYVIVASPAPYHIEIAKKLLAHDIAVLIEKPLAHSVESCDALLLFCSEKKRTTVAVGYCLRFLPSARVVKDFLNQGLLGTLYNVHASVGQYLPSWRADKNYKDSVSANKALGGGVLLELSHELDYLQWLLGNLSLQHSWLRTTDELGLDVEDIANLVLISDENVYISLHLDFIQKSPHRYCEFIGHNGRLLWDLVGNSVTFFHATGKTDLYSKPKYDKNKMYIKMLSEFERILKKTSTSVESIDSTASIESATKIVKLIEEAKRSSKWRKHY